MRQGYRVSCCTSEENSPFDCHTILVAEVMVRTSWALAANAPSVSHRYLLYLLRFRLEFTL